MRVLKAPLSYTHINSCLYFLPAVTVVSSGSPSPSPAPSPSPSIVFVSNSTSGPVVTNTNVVSLNNNTNSNVNIAENRNNITITVIAKAVAKGGNTKRADCKKKCEKKYSCGHSRGLLWACQLNKNKCLKACEKYQG